MGGVRIYILDLWTLKSSGTYATQNTQTETCIPRKLQRTTPHQIDSFLSVFTVERKNIGNSVHIGDKTATDSGFSPYLSVLSTIH